MARKRRVPASKQKSRKPRRGLHLNGELYLELEGMGGVDHATRACVAFPYPKGAHLKLAGDYHARVENFGGSVGFNPKQDLVRIFLNTKNARDGFHEADDEEAVSDFLNALSARGWKLHRVSSGKPNNR